MSDPLNLPQSDPKANPLAKASATMPVALLHGDTAGLKLNSAPEAITEAGKKSIADATTVSMPSTAPKAVVLGGATGMLGQALVKAVKLKGWQVHTLGREDGPVTSQEFLEARLAALNPDFIFNAIAYTAVDDAEDHSDDAIALNRKFPALLGRMMRDRSAHLLHFSTDFVFNGKNRKPYTEDDPTDPLCVYGSSKLGGEQGLMGVDNACIIRTAWLFGPGRKNFVDTILKVARAHPQITVVHDQVGSPTYTVDVATMALALASARATGIVHAVNGGQASWCELACEALALANVHSNVVPIPSDQWPQKARRPAYSVLSTERLTALTGIKPRPWPMALREYIFESLQA